MKAPLLVSASAVALFALPVAAQAQSSDAPPPADKATGESARPSEDIIVTATRRSERLQDVPLSVTAFGQRELDDLGIVGYEGIAQNTPGIVVNRPTQNFNNFTARGINTNGYSAGLQSAVAIYVDELARLLLAVTADKGETLGRIYEPDDGQDGGWTHREFARAIGRAVGRPRVPALSVPAAVLKAGGHLDRLVRRDRAKLTPDRAAYIAHPDWVATAGTQPPAALWQPALATDEALAETVRWYREQGWL